MVPATYVDMLMSCPHCLMVKEIVCARHFTGDADMLPGGAVQSTLLYLQPDGSG